MSVQDEIMHYGVLGMKWGKHRSSTSSPSSKTNVSDDYRESQRIKKKSVSELSNAELRKYNERANLERQFKDLSKKDVSKGQKFVSDILTNSGKTAATTIATAAILYGGKKLIAAKFGEDVVSSMFKKK